MQSSLLFKKSLSSSYPTVSGYVSRLLYSFEGIDRDYLCLANQDWLCDAFIFNPKLCRIQLAIQSRILACAKSHKAKVN